MTTLIQDAFEAIGAEAFAAATQPSAIAARDGGAAASAKFDLDQTEKALIQAALLERGIGSAVSGGSAGARCGGASAGVTSGTSSRCFLHHSDSKSIRLLNVSTLIIVIAWIFPSRHAVSILASELRLLSGSRRS